jgi:hypothetical protein
VTGFEIAVLAYTGALWLPGIFCLWRIPRCSAAPLRTDGRGSAPLPAETRGPAARHSLSVSVIVPARNEERRIAPLLESLARQKRRADEIIVVDDESADGTANLARRLGARVISAPAKPEGWVGKTWACWTGAREASGDLFAARRPPESTVRHLAVSLWCGRCVGPRASGRTARHLPAAEHQLAAKSVPHPLP